MRLLAWALLLVASPLLTSGREPSMRVIEVSNADELMAAFRAPLENVTVSVIAGRYIIAPTDGELRTWTMCHDSTQVWPASSGLVIRGRHIRVTGPVDGEAVIATGADYRIHFDGCTDCILERVTIASVAPDRPSRLKGAAVLATNSSILVRNCHIDNTALVAEAPPRIARGIEGADGTLDIEFNEIRGSDTGIAIREGAAARISNNLLEGRRIGTVNTGLGLLMSCDSRATVERNHMRDLGDGVQLSDAASLELRANIIEDVHDNGIGSSHYGLGRVVIEKNVVYGCGGAGIGMRVDGNQRAASNFIVDTGRVKPRPGAIWLLGERAHAANRKNTLYDNTVTDPALDRDVPREIFWRERRQWTRTYRNTPVGVDGRHRFHESAFLTRYGRWLH